MVTWRIEIIGRKKRLYWKLGALLFVGVMLGAAFWELLEWTKRNEVRKHLFEGKEGNWQEKRFSVEKNDTGKVEAIGPKKPLKGEGLIPSTNLKKLIFDFEGFLN